MKKSLTLILGVTLVLTMFAGHTFVPAAAPTPAHALTDWINGQLNDTSDSYSRVWAIFDQSPGQYQGSGQWTAGALCSGTYSSGDFINDCDISSNYSSTPYYYICVSVPDTGYGSYSGYLTYHVNGAEQNSNVSGITENNCAQSSNPYYP